jgi:hypothetical protein
MTPPERPARAARLFGGEALIGFIIKARGEGRNFSEGAPVGNWGFTMFPSFS